MLQERETTSRGKVLSALVLSLSITPAAVADWPGFRGPHSNGVSEERGLPIGLSEKDSLAWKTRLPGPGASSPIVSEDRVFVTCWSGYGDAKSKAGDVSNLRRHLVCLDRPSGKILWQSDVATRLPELPWRSQIMQHGYTTSTPVTDGKSVYVYFGRTGVLAYDFTGKELWHADVGKILNSFGSGASLALYRNLLIVNATVECGRLLALDKATGKEVWRVRINGDTWSTPVVVEVAGGKHEVVFSAPGTLYGFDPETGKELWQCECPEPDYVSSTPVVRGDIVYIMGTGNAGRLFQAVRTGGRGDVTNSHIVWRQKVGASFCSPVLAGDLLYFFSVQAVCLRADTGKLVLEERLAGLGREYASPVVADGRIYLFTRRGNGHVLAASERMERLGSIELGEAGGFTASPAVSHGQLFVRSNDYLYCIGGKR